MGVGDLGLRALPGLRRTAWQLFEQRAFDAVFITIYPTYPAVLGPMFKRRFGVPFVLDYQDPWVGAWGRDVGGGAAGAVDFKSRSTRALAERLEPRVLRAADGVTAVSARTYEDACARTGATPRAVAEIPIGWDAADLDALAPPRRSPAAHPRRRAREHLLHRDAAAARRGHAARRAGGGARVHRSGSAPRRSPSLLLLRDEQPVNGRRGARAAACARAGRRASRARASGASRLPRRARRAPPGVGAAADGQLGTALHAQQGVSRAARESSAAGRVSRPESGDRHAARRGAAAGRPRDLVQRRASQSRASSAASPTRWPGSCRRRASRCTSTARALDPWSARALAGRLASVCDRVAA